MEIIFIRHGSVKGNIEKRYIGSTDEPLCSEGISTIKKIKLYTDNVISSPMKRCIQTAYIIFGHIDYICNDLKECNFGDFEGKNYNDLKYNKYYQMWLDSMGTLPFPNGETPENFRARCCKAFEYIVNKYSHKKSIAFVIHEGSIRAILEKYAKPQKNFYDWHISNGGVITFNMIYDNDKILLYDLN